MTSHFFSHTGRPGTLVPALVIRAEREGAPAQEHRDPPTAAPPPLGPGDVAGIEPGQVVRRVPAPGEQQLATNHVVAIEFADPALPWLFGEGRQTGASQWLPWLLLVVVPDRPEHQPRHRVGSPNPVLTIDRALLPDPRQAASWAHTQVEAETPELARARLATGGHSPLSRARLVAPYRLAADQSYLACLVPVYEAGRRAGLSGELSTAAGTWHGTGEVSLPVYDHWRFATGAHGDFRHLVERLRPPQALECGGRTVAIDAVAARLQARQPGTAPLFPPQVWWVPTAITRIGASPPQSPPALVERLRQVVDLGASTLDDDEDEEDPIVGPPLYGQWQAGVRAIDGLGEGSWLAELNSEPGWRIAAGLGAQVVRRNQERLMSQAWEQLATVRQANERIRWAQLAAAVAEPMYDEVEQLPPGQALRLVNVAAGTGVAGSPGTAAFAPTAPAVPARRGAGDLPALAEQVAGSNVPPEVFGAAFLHTARYASLAAAPEPTDVDGRTALPTEWLAPTGFVDTAMAALSDGDPEFLPAHLHLPQPVEPELDPGRLVEVVAAVELAERAGPVVLAENSRSLRELIVALAHPDELVMAVAEEVVVPDPARWQGRDAAWELERVALDRLGLGRLPIEQAPARLIGWEEPVELIRWEEPVELIRWEEPVAVEVAPDLPEPGRLALTTAEVVGGLDPQPLYPHLLSQAHTLVGADPRRPERQLLIQPAQRTPLTPIMAAPVLDFPGVELLRALDPEWILGGAGALDEDIIALLACDQRFVEAFLAGANHELARELHWRGYPTDLRGTSLRWFWEPVGAETDDPSQPLRQDVTPIDQWRGRLGEHRPPGTVPDFAVLVVKGELLRRYPSTVIGLERGRVENNRYTVVGEPVAELFRGVLAGDIAYVAYDVGREQVLADQWYVTLTEPGDEPSLRHELDIPSQLSPLPPANLGGTGAAIGARLYQQPVKLLLPAGEYL